MKITTMMKHTVNYVLVTALLGLTVTGCFESNSEKPAPGLNTSGGEVVSLGVDDTLRVSVDSGGGSVDVLRNDSDGVQISTFDTASTGGGSVSQDSLTGYLIYTPQPGFSGADSFTYTVRNSAGKTGKLTVHVTVNNDIIASGRDFFNRECGICHKAGVEDQQSAFNATDLVLSTNNFDYDMSLSDQMWNPPLMGFYNNLSQIELDGLRAYIASLRTP